MFKWGFLFSTICLFYLSMLTFLKIIFHNSWFFWMITSSKIQLTIFTKNF